jgi:hypothetical protein
VNQVIVADQMENTANPGAAVALSNIWLDNVIVAYVDPSGASDLQVPTFGRVFGWTGEVGPDGVLIESYRDDEVRSATSTADGMMCRKRCACRKRVIT